MVGLDSGAAGARIEADLAACVVFCSTGITAVTPQYTLGIKALSLYSYPGEGIYFGGYKGSSIISWFRENIDRTIVPINGANSYIYEVTDEDYNCRLIFGYTTVRSDLVVRELKMSEPTDRNYEGIKKLLSEGAGLEICVNYDAGFYGFVLSFDFYHRDTEGSLEEKAGYSPI
ncbi:hypothetical protein Hanom_Chr06g00561391 [Helianthus anomalus]